MAQVGRSMSATTQTTTEGTTPVVAASPVATPAASPADIAALAADPVAFEQALAASGTNLAELDSVLATPSAKPANYAGKVPEAVTPPPAAATPAPAATPAAEAKPGETPAAASPAAAPEAAKPTDDDGEGDPLQGIKGIKIKPSSFQDMEVLRLMKPRNGQAGLTAAEAVAKVYGTPAPAAPAATTTSAAPAATPTPAEPAALTEAKASLATLEAQLAKATEDADVGVVAKTMREISKVERAIERAEQEAQAAKREAEHAKADEANTTFRQHESVATKEIISAFPKLGDPASPERAEFQQFINLKHGDPLYGAIFASPLWPKVLGREFAEAKGWNKAPAPAPAQGTPAPTPGAAPAPRVTAAEVLTPGATQGGASITAETFVQDVTKMSLRDLDAILAAAR